MLHIYIINVHGQKYLKQLEYNITVKKMDIQYVQTVGSMQLVRQITLCKLQGTYSPIVLRKNVKPLIYLLSYSNVTI